MHFQINLFTTRLQYFTIFVFSQRYILEILKKLMYTNVCPEYFLYKWRINGGKEEGLGWGNSSSFDADFLINSS